MVFLEKKIAEQFGISQQTVSDIKKKESIKTFALNFDVGKDRSSASNRQILKKPKEVLLEEAVLKWFSQQRTSGIDVSGIELKAAAENFAKHPESYAGGSIATGRATLAGQVEG
jgi:hypothetical protein